MKLAEVIPIGNLHPPNIRLETAMRALASARTPNELIRIVNTAEALRVYATRAKLGLQAQNMAAVVRLWAERRIGEFLARTERNAGGRPLKKPVPLENGFSPARLRELGIDRKLSARAQRLAAIPVSDFKAWLDQSQQRQIEISTRDLLNFFDRGQAAAQNRQRIVGGRVADLVAFARAGNRLGTLYLDPPWPFDGTVLPYETIDLDELRTLPIPALAAERCHIHMWATGINFQFVAKNILEAWGFRVVGEFVWVKRSLGGRNFWRQSHEVMLTAVRANMDDRFDDHGLRSWIEAPRGRHSEKPEVVRALIERASPGPRLELFARSLTPGWYAWGHEIAAPLSVQHVSIGRRGVSDGRKSERRTRNEFEPDSSTKSIQISGRRFEKLQAARCKLERVEHAWMATPQQHAIKIQEQKIRRTSG